MECYFVQAAALTEPPPRCRFCLVSPDNARLSRRDFATFYSTFQSCGLGKHFSQSELLDWVCTYCWTRAMQCVKFVQCARAAERVLGNISVYVDIQACRFYNLSINKLEVTEHTCGQMSPDSSYIKCYNLPEPASNPRLPNDTLFFLPATLNEKLDATVSPRDHQLYIKTESQDEENIDIDNFDSTIIDDDNMKAEPNTMDQEKSGKDLSSNVKIITQEEPSLKLGRTMREVETEKLKKLHMEPLKYSVQDMIEEIQIKKCSERYLKKKYQCQKCGSAYNEEEAYDSHILRFHHESAGEFECDACKYRFPTRSLLSRHVTTHARRWRCLDCGCVLTARGACATHRARCGAAPQAHVCQQCGRHYSSEMQLRIHTRRAHKRQRVKRFTCDMCGKTFEYKHQLRDHIRSHLNIKPFECESCGKKFTSRALYGIHKKTHEPRAAPEERYCVECDRYFMSPRLLEQHLTSSLNHVTKDTFRHPCSECPDRFKSASLLQLHVNTVHLLNRSHRCQQCGKAYYTRGALKAHARNKHVQAERRRDHVCSVCGKAFLASTSLKNHMVGVHQKERPYACNICDATFGFKAALYTHNKLKHKMANQRADTGTNRARFAAPP